MNLGVMFGYRHADLNRFNRPVRTRMPGGVAGERPLWLPPMPIPGARCMALHFS
jgi:hypothetical protein